MQTWAPEFSAKDLSGKTVTLSDCLEDGPVVVVFWGSWCRVCKNLLSELDKLHRTYRDHGFRVVAVAQDDPKTILAVKQVVTQKKWEMIVLTDPKKEVGNLFNVRNYPTWLLVNQDRTIAAFFQGYMPGDEKQLEAKVIEILGEETGATETSGTTPETGASR